MNDADIIINNILKTGNLPNIQHLNGNKITIKLDTLTKMINTIKDLEKDYIESENKIALLNDRIQELEMSQPSNNTNVMNMVCVIQQKYMLSQVVLVHVLH